MHLSAMARRSPRGLPTPTVADPVLQSWVNQMSEQMRRLEADVDAVSSGRAPEPGVALPRDGTALAYLALPSGAEAPARPTGASWDLSLQRLFSAHPWDSARPSLAAGQLLWCSDAPVSGAGRVPVPDAAWSAPVVCGGGPGQGFDWRGDWSADADGGYEINDCVESDGRAWICIEDHQPRADDPPTDENDGSVGTATVEDPADRWDLLADAGQGFRWRGPWSAAATGGYEINDCVESDGRAWICIEDHQPRADNPPTEDNDGSVGTDTDQDPADRWNLLAGAVDGTTPLTAHVSQEVVAFTGGRPDWSPAVGPIVTVTFRRGAAILAQARFVAKVKANGYPDRYCADGSAEGWEGRRGGTGDWSVCSNTATLIHGITHPFPHPANPLTCEFSYSDGDETAETAVDLTAIQDGLTRADAKITVGGDAGPSTGNTLGDLWIDADGEVHQWDGSAWEATDLDLTGPAGAKIHTGAVAAGQSPGSPAGVKDGDVFLARDGRWWTRAGGAWTYEGDLTGPGGDKGDNGTTPLTASVSQEVVAFTGGRPDWSPAVGPIVIVTFRRGSAILREARFVPKVKSDGIPDRYRADGVTEGWESRRGGSGNWGANLDTATHGSEIFHPFPHAANPLICTFSYTDGGETETAAVELTAVRDGADGAGGGQGEVWSATRTYSREDVVLWYDVDINGSSPSSLSVTMTIKRFVSLLNNNLNNQPPEDGSNAWWRLMTSQTFTR